MNKLLYIFLFKCIRNSDYIVTTALQQWRKEINAVGNQVIGVSAVYLQQKECSTGECNLGNFVTDAMLYAVSFYEILKYFGKFHFFGFSFSKNKTMTILIGVTLL